MTQTTLLQLGFSASAALFCLAACSGAPAKPDSGGEQTVASLADRYFEDVVFKYFPSRGTRAGFHQYDDRLEDYSRGAIDSQLAALKDYERRTDALRAPASAPESDAADRELLLSDIRSGILEIETVRNWEKDPDIYSSGITQSAFIIMSRNFASPDARLRSLVSREKQMPAVFQAARANLENPPRRYTEIALEQLPGIVRFFEQDVPAAFKDAKDQATLRDFAQSNAQVIAALRSYEQYLRDDVLPRSNGDYRLGPDTYRKKLAVEEMVEIPLDRLLEIGFADLRKNQREFQRIAGLLSPGQSAQDALAKLGADHPRASDLLQAFRATFDGLRGFIASHQVVTIPSPVLPIVEETPPFGRALSFASMDIPGPFEQRATEAFFNVTLPEPSWTAKQVEEHMEAFNRGTIISTAVHEAYPGHYVQFLWVQRAPSKVRKLIGTGSNAEGWAHYTEQMMLDEGYGRTAGSAEEKDPRFLELRLGQLQDALLRNARYIVGIQMHTGSMTFDQGVEFFEKEGYQTHANALRETKRGTRDPTYLVYTLGKLQILKLRDDYRRKLGASFTLQQFHDEFLKQGFPPVKIVRRALLGDDSPTL
jgi:uncharacterized protein (DUF885 family)